jgi:hypothetical protein
MKKIILHPIVLIFALTTFYSCTKSKPETVAEKLQHTWNLVTNVNNDTPTGGFDTTYGTPQDILTFEKNGVLIGHLYGSNDTSFYFILDANRIVLETNDTATINTLTDTQLIWSDDDVTSGLKSTTTFKR